MPCRVLPCLSPESCLCRSLRHTRITTTRGRPGSPKRRKSSKRKFCPPSPRRSHYSPISTSEIGSPMFRREIAPSPVPQSPHAYTCNMDDETRELITALLQSVGRSMPGTPRPRANASPSPIASKSRSRMGSPAQSPRKLIRRTHAPIKGSSPVPFGAERSDALGPVGMGMFGLGVEGNSDDGSSDGDNGKREAPRQKRPGRKLF